MWNISLSRVERVVAPERLVAVAQEDTSLLQYLFPRKHTVSLLELVELGRRR
jgi:hypothetical protein